MVFKNLRLLENMPRHSGNQTHRARTKCGGKSWWNSLHRMHRKHIYHCTYDPFLHIVRLHFILQIILHLIHLWVRSFKFRKRYSVDTVQFKCGGESAFHPFSFFFVFISFYFQPFKQDHHTFQIVVTYHKIFFLKYDSFAIDTAK